MSESKLFEKGSLYVLRGLAKNKQYVGMMNYNGQLYLSDGKGYASNRPTFYDGDLFVALHDIDAFDAEAIVESLDGDITSMNTLRALEQAKVQYDRETVVTMLSPDGQVVRMRLKGNKTKFKKVTKRTRKVK